MPRCKFEAFLLASIGEDSSDNGMQLSVLSALARQNVDPWEEAASLACLPSEAATRRLTSLIAALPKGRSTRAEPRVDAARLIALLPRGVGPDNRSHVTTLGRVAAQSWPVRQVMVYVISVAVMLVIQWLIANHLAAAPRHLSSAPNTSTASAPATALRNAGQ